mgnify:CR=1 FL=1
MKNSSSSLYKNEKHDYDNEYEFKIKSFAIKHNYNLFDDKVIQYAISLKDMIIDSLEKNSSNSDKTKLNVLRKFGYFIREDQEDTILRCLHQTVSFHTEYPHQVDGEHTDQKYTLQTFTIQVYLPTDDSIKDYGTQFVNHDRETVYHRSFLPNTGYMMASNNNSWHKPTMGVERKSLLVRYHLEIDYNKHQRLFNYNKDNDTCYVVWNKYMDVHPKITDWMATMTFINLSFAEYFH